MWEAIGTDPVPSTPPIQPEPTQEQLLERIATSRMNALLRREEKRLAEAAAVAAAASASAAAAAAPASDDAQPTDE